MRFVRSLRNALTLLSLLMCIAAAMLWSRSYSWIDRVTAYGPWPRAHQWRYSLEFYSSHGVLMVETSGVEFEDGFAAADLVLDADDHQRLLGVTHNERSDGYRLNRRLGER
jgi:hypothetical protein